MALHDLASIYVGFFFGRFYTALALHDLAHEMPLSAVAAKYGATKGMLQSLQQAASTFAGGMPPFLIFVGFLSGIFSPNRDDF